jgi:2-octaprenyl-6-methoxyphenol hydroxylase
MALNELSNAQIIIQGAGPVGLACTIALLHANHDLKVVLLDKNPASDAFLFAGDTRGIAISEGSKQLLDNLGAWVEEAPSIREVHVSHKGYFGQTTMRNHEIHQDALGHIVRYRDIVLALRKKLRILQPQCPHLQWLHEFNDDLTTHDFSAETCIVHADGGLFHDQAAKDVHKDYGQSALVGWLEISNVQPHMAWERFTQDGPIAILPHHQGSDFKNFVWCAPSEKITSLANLDANHFMQALNLALQIPIGEFIAVHDRKVYPLGLNFKKEIIQHNQVWIGNSAQTLHPVAGQGLNLGLRDAITLANILNQVFSRPSTDKEIALESALKHYQKTRSKDRKATIQVTDLMASVFRSDFLPIVLGRGLALSALQWITPVKNRLAKQMMFGQR